MKIIKLNSDFTINFGNPIEENSEAGIKQAVLEVLKSIKNFDVYNLGSGIDFYIISNNNLQEMQEALRDDIIKQVRTIPYVQDVQNFNFNLDKQNNILHVAFDVKYIHENQTSNILPIEYNYANVFNNK